MSFHHSHSCECWKPEVDPFSLPSTQTSIESSQWIHYKPVSSLTDDAPIEFVVPGYCDEYLDLAYTMLSLRVKSVTPERVATNTVHLDNVGPVNNFMHSLFNQVDVYVNQNVVSSPSNSYAYRSYVDI
ncbi:uncharacterized protein F54H12.2-like [Belonocnema kinseyi]|uniref:uncharacterized protein F54H12.2-like n=1 Tax=Belonocnema kinseyi TaxID=2817044 RepID=UPI00143D922B|nr:uncharacterized protein F54H12.2-like [Belonocnema kinseyi]